MIQRAGSSAKSLTLMFIALALVFVYMACVFPDIMLLMYFIATLCTMGVVVEGSPVLVIVFLGAVIGISLILAPDFVRLVPYLFFFAHYPIGKFFIDSDTKKLPAAKLTIKIAYFSGALALMYFVTNDLFMSMIPEELSFVLFIIILEAVFVGYDWLLTRLTGWYVAKLRTNLKRSTY